jgi:uncharacterized membrane protein
MAQPSSAKRRLLSSFTAGIVAALLLVLLGQSKFAPLVAWDVMAITYVTWVWLTVWRLDVSATRAHAVTEDPGHRLYYYPSQQ